MPLQLSEAKNQFISNWGAFATHWGINKTMAQVHALLLINTKPLCAEDIMEQLQISRGNVNMNVRELIDWNLVERITIVGERKEYFSAEKDIWKVVTQIIKERKKRELEPMLRLMKQLQERLTALVDLPAVHQRSQELFGKLLEATHDYLQSMQLKQFLVVMALIR